MLNFETSRLEKSSRELSEGFENQMSWKWDDRFETALAEFNAKDRESVEKIITIHMSAIWDFENFRAASLVVQNLIKCFGGLNKGQLLFTSEPDSNGLVLCAALWPWGNGTTISIRMGVFGDGLGDDENAELTRLFRGWYHL